LQIMRHRARMIGGQLSFRNDPDGGVVVTCTAPIQGSLTPRLVKTSPAKFVKRTSKATEPVATGRLHDQ
jgi:hypothetical protein